MLTLNLGNFYSIFGRIWLFKSAAFHVLAGITKLNYHDNDKNNFRTYYFPQTHEGNRTI